MATILKLYNNLVTTSVTNLIWKCQECTFTIDLVRGFDVDDLVSKVSRHRIEKHNGEQYADSQGS